MNTDPVTESEPTRAPPKRPLTHIDGRAMSITGARAALVGSVGESTAETTSSAVDGPAGLTNAH